MADKPLKQRLLETLVASQDRERELGNLVDDARIDPERWTAKDHVAHLAHWRRHAALVLASVHAGSPPPDAGDVDELNATVHAANLARPAVEVAEDARVSYAELARAIEDSTDENLLSPREGRDGAVWEVVPPNCHMHLGEHLVFWHEAHGEDQAAEQAQLWSVAVQEASFTDPKSRAYARYNLACYYARNGRATEALPHLKGSFELNPDLKEWASKDKDLDRVRENPEVSAILA